jgi:hypothetical protein
VDTLTVAKRRIRAMRICIISVIAALIWHTPISAAEGTQSKVPSSSTALSAVVQGIRATLATFLQGKPPVQKIQYVRTLLAQLGGEEAQVAGQLALAIEQAEAQGVKGPTVDEINRQLSRVRRTFADLTAELNATRDLSAFNPQVVAGLSCLMADSVLFGYLGGCPTFVRVPNGVVPPTGQPTRQFQAGKNSSTNAEARRILAAIQNESSYFLELANTLDAALRQ